MNEGWLRAAGVAGILLTIAALTWPVYGHFSGSVVGPYGGVDAVMQAGILAWTGSSFWRPAVWIDMPIFFPEPGALTCMDSLLGQALAALPLRLAGIDSAAACYNFALIVSLLLAAAGMAAIWRIGGGAWSAGAVGSLALIGSPYTLSQMGHLNQLPPPGFLLATIGLLLVLRRRSKGQVLGWCLWGAGMAMQAAWGWYGLSYAFILSGLFLGWGGWCSFRARRLGAFSRRLLWPLLAVAAVVALLAWPYWRMAERHADYRRGVAEVRAFSADLADLLNRGAYRPQLSDWLGGDKSEAERLAASDRQVLHPGWCALGLAMSGFVLRRRLTHDQRRLGYALLAGAVVGFVFAFGDSVRLPGADRRLVLPFGLLQDVLPPLQAFRAAWRFSFLALLAVCWWAAAGFTCLGQLARPGPRRAAVALGMLALLCLESLPVKLPAVHLSDLRQGAQAWSTAPVGAVLTLPAPATEAAEDLIEAGWLHRALMHGRPVTGGVSGWVPPFTRRLRQRLEACEQGREQPSDLLRELARNDIRNVELAERADDPRCRYWRRELVRLGYEPLQAGDRYTRFALRH